MNIREVIIENLNGRPNYVNTFVALKGLNFTDGLDELRNMVCHGIVEIDRMPMLDEEGQPKRGSYYTFYRLRNG